MEENTIICGDCLEVMKDWPDGCVDLVLTDPPYNVGLNYDIHSDNIKDYPAFVRKLSGEGIRLSNKFAVTSGIRNIDLYPKPKWILCWSKPNSMRRNDLGGFNMWEPILFYGKKVIYQDLFKCPTIPQADNGHPCPKPLELFKWLVRVITEPNDLILDPFCGSGTTCVAAKMLGRRYIGIDISPDYCQIAEDRLRAVDTGVPVKEARAGQGALFE